jgi:hypothetical protein
VGLNRSHRSVHPVSAVILGLIFLFGRSAFAQSAPQSSPAAVAQTGMSTGGVHSGIFDSEKRPITAGGFVDSGPIVFQDAAKESGLTTWRHVMG